MHSTCSACLVLPACQIMGFGIGQVPTFDLIGAVSPMQPLQPSLLMSRLTGMQLFCKLLKQAAMLCPPWS